MIKMIVFDMAGTTVDEDNIVYKTVQRAVNDAGYDFTLDQVLAVAAGKEKLQAILSVLALKNIVDEDLAKDIFKAFSVMLTKAYSTESIKPQKSANEVFLKLKNRGILVVLNTGYSREMAELILQKIDWKVGSDIDALVTASDVEKNRPNPDMIDFAMHQFGIDSPADVIKIGDSDIDIEEGKNAGCEINIGITTGAHTREQLESAGPTYIISDLIELLDIVDEK